MLQTRFENEKFETLPLILSSHRSRNDYITTDRPDSSQLVDLHIYIIPKSVWKNFQHLAQNEAMDDAISAGFVRVSPERKLRDLRESIENLCGTEPYFPREFIFLRSVGRCLTRVKPSQENELKVKNYRPPQAIASEIYLLEGRHEDYGNIPSASPVLSSASYIFGTRRQYRYNFDDSNPEPLKNSPRKPLRGNKNDHPIMNSNHVTYRRSPSKRKPGSQLIQSNSDDPSPNASIESTTAKELNKLKEEQERLRRRQDELGRMRRAAEEKRFQLHNERRREEQEKLEREAKEQLEREKKERERQEQAAERRRQRREEKAEAERQRLEKLELAATRIQASFRGFQDRQRFRERQRNLLLNLSRESSTKDEVNFDDDDLSDGSEILSGTSIGSTSDFDSSSSRIDTRIIKQNSNENLRSSSPLFERTFRSLRPLIHSKTEDLSTLKDNFHLDEKIRAATVTKIRYSDDEIRPISSSDDEIYEIKRREAEMKRQRQLEDDKHKTNEFDDRQRRDLDKIKQREDPESLRARLEKLRSERIQQERIRDEVIKQLRHVHQRITVRRKDARDMWKKKYFQEKKKTNPIEEQIAQLKTDVDFFHSKTIQIMENESKHATQVGAVNEAELGNLLVEITRLRHEIKYVRRQVDHAKLRLTTDVKLRNQAEVECGLLKHELIQARMNLNHIKTRQKN